MRPLLLVATVLALWTAPLPAGAQGEPGGWSGALFADGLESPVDVVFGPDGTLYYAELDSGKVRAIPPGATQPLPEPVVQVASSRAENAGFLGLALDPDFAQTGAFFVYYSTEKPEAPDGKVNRVSRIDAAGERVILDDIPWDELHNGGRLVFTGPDTLVVVTGDNELREPAQDPESLLGKTLRMTREGAPAPDNPDPTSLVWSIGHRNPFGLAYDAESDILWNTENGPQHGDEVNILRAGENYGWPAVVGLARHPAYVDPVVEYDDTIAPTGGTVLEGDFYFGAVNDGKIRRVAQQEDGSYADAVVWDNKVPTLDVEAGPDGRLYVASFAAIYVLAPPGHVAPPPPTPPSAAEPTPPTQPPATPGPDASDPTPAPEEAARIPGAGAALLLGGLAAVALALARRG